MIMDNERKGLYYGWVVVFICATLMALCFAPTINLSGIFVTPISEEFGVNRTSVTTLTTISTICSTIMSLFAGKIFKRNNIKRIMSVASFIMGLAFLGRSFAPNVYFLYMFAGIGGTAFALLSTIPISILVNNWFGPTLRGRAQGLAVVGSGVGAMILNPVLGYVNEAYGWRVSYRIISGLILLVVFPLLTFLLYPTPESKGVVRIGDDASFSQRLSGPTQAEAMKTPIFWIMAVAFILYSATSTVFNVNGAPYYQDIGLPPVRAAAMISISSLALTISKPALGALCDKIGSFKGAITAGATISLSMILMIVASFNIKFAIPSAIVFGLGNALPTVTLPLLTAEIFGNRDYVALVAIMNVFSSVGSAIGPVLGSGLYDAAGSYVPAWYVVLALMALMIVLTYVAMMLNKKELEKDSKKSF